MSEVFETPQPAPRIGSEAPPFTAETTQGSVCFPDDYAGRWVVFVSHPSDFTPTCTSEIMTLAVLQEEFDALNTDLLGLSIDGLYSHIGWLRAITKEIEFRGMSNVVVKFPIITDVTMSIANAYGMVMPDASPTQTVRSTFVIDPTGIIRAIMHYPRPVGRSMVELRRLVLALQTADAMQVATPADWRPGDPVIIPPAGSCGTARERVEGHEEGVVCSDWYFCTKEVTVEQVDAAITAKAEKDRKEADW